MFSLEKFLALISLSLPWSVSEPQGCNSSSCLSFSAHVFFGKVSCSHILIIGLVCVSTSRQCSSGFCNSTTSLLHGRFPSWMWLKCPILVVEVKENIFKCLCPNASLKMILILKEKKCLALESFLSYRSLHATLPFLTSSPGFHLWSKDPNINTESLSQIWCVEIVICPDNFVCVSFDDFVIATCSLEYYFF